MSSTRVMRSTYARLRRAPVRGQLVEHEGSCARDRDALLRERVAVADRDRVVLERLLVDRQRVRRADLVLAAVAAADLARVVVLGDDRATKLLVQRTRLADHVVVAWDQREHGDLHGREGGWRRSTVRSRSATTSSSYASTMNASIERFTPSAGSTTCGV